MRNFAKPSAIVGAIALTISACSPGNNTSGKSNNACGILEASIENAPSILLSQIGYAPNSRKIAVLRSDSSDPVAWNVFNANGESVLAGNSIPFGTNATSGDSVHQIDLSSLTAMDDDYRIEACGFTSRNFSIQPGKQRDLAFHTLKYFYHNRSGTPILAEHVQESKWARSVAFADNSVATCFYGKDELGVEWPACDYKLDIKGGWFDAGDFGKYVVNGGIALWTLQDAFEKAPTLWGDGSANIPESGNNISDLLDETRYQLEFMMSMQVPDGANVAVGRTNADGAETIVKVDGSGLVHHKTHALKWADFPMRPEQSTAEQFLYPPSTAATLNLAAPAAQAARLWREIDPEFSAKALASAERAFAAAVREPNLFAEDRFDGGGAYRDKHIEDEMSWAAAELYVTTGKAEYLDYVNFAPKQRKKPNGLLGWPQVRLLTSFAILRAGDTFDASYVEKARAAIMEAADQLIETRAKEGYAFPLSDQGYTWGSTGRIANNAMILATAYELTDDAKYRGAVVDTVDFMLGRNAIDQSYITGIGERAVQNPHHRFWGHSLDASLPTPPPGAVSGGPNNRNFADKVAKTLDSSCAPQTCWIDHADAFSLNEVAVNWNAPVFWISSFLHDTETQTN